MSEIYRFDIFAGSYEKDAQWMEAIPGLARARERMEEIAAQKPGKYFVFSPLSHSVLAQVDTSKNLIPAENRAKARGVA